MAYSDYGSYNWSKENGEWVYKPEFEDSSLQRGQMDKTLENATGLKLDIVLDRSNEDPSLPWYVTRSSHSVIGRLYGWAVVSYKGYPVVVHNGEEVDDISWEDNDSRYYDEESNTFKEKEGFVPKVIDITEGNNRVKVLMSGNHSVAWVKNGDEEHLSFCGYGIGEHWWLDDEGFENPDELGEGETPNKWPREKECLEKSLALIFG